MLVRRDTFEDNVKCIVCCIVATTDQVDNVKAAHCIRLDALGMQGCH